MSGYDTFMKRVQLAGGSMRQSKINDAIHIETLTNHEDPSYCDSFYRWINGICPRDDIQIHPRLYDRKKSSAAGHTMKMKTLISEPIKCGETFHNTKDNTWWICTATDCIDDIDYISTLTECNYTLKFQLGSSDIYEYKCQDLNSTQYNSGVTEGKQMILLSSQHMLTLPDDDIVLSLPQDKRFFLARKPELARHVYKLTQNDTTSDIGICSVTVIQTELDNSKDNIELGICDYISPDEPTTPLPPNKSDILTKIEGNKDLKLGYKRTYTAQFFDKNDENTPVTMPADFSWNVICDFTDALTQEIDGSSISFLIDDEDYLDERFVLQALIGGQVVDSMTITVTGVYGR